MEVAAVVALVLVVVLVGFQLALALGVPWGAAAWGGAHAGVLPTGLRVASGVAGVVVYPAIGWLLAVAGGLVDPGWEAPVWALWVLVGFFGLGAVVNAISRSRPERIWAPVSLLLAITSAVIALGM
ncbi:MAG: hypothetical protein AB1Z57_07005 [Acidimicrobiia bacterium]